MAALNSHTSFDSLDAHALSMCWAGVVGFAEDPDDPNEPGGEECMISSSDGTQRLLFIEVTRAARLIMVVVGVGLLIRGVAIEVLLAADVGGLRDSVGQLQTHWSLAL